MIRRPSIRRTLAALGLATGIALLLPSGSAEAHPLGNLTSNTAAAVTVAPDGVAVAYVLDLAELPTLQARQTMDTDRDGTVSAAEGNVYRDAECAGLAAGLRIVADGTALPLQSTAGTLSFPPGQAGLVTTRLECSLHAASRFDRSVALVVDDTNLADHVGWREITAVGDGMQLTTDLASVSSSAALTAYPKGVSPERVVHGDLTARPGGPRLAGSASDPAAASSSTPQARGADGLTERFQRLVGSHRLTAGLFVLVVGLSFVLGAFHALAPGHGKTLMAAAVVARRGTTRQIVGIGATVTLTHTAGVLALGTVIWLSDAVAPDRLLPWLTVASGLLVAGLGITLLVRRFVLGQVGHGHHHLFGDHDHGPLGHDHDGHDHPHPHPHDDHGHDHDPGHVHEHGHEPALALVGGGSSVPAHPLAHDDHEHGHLDHHSHDHHGHDHGADDHGHDHPHPHAHDHPHPRSHERGRPDRELAPALSRRWVVTMGIAGGLVPTPSALVVLLGATALGRAWLGVVLVTIYGLGMATTLLVAGVAMVRLQSWLEHHWYDRAWLKFTMRVAPVFTAVVLVVGGTSIVVRGALGV